MALSNEDKNEIRQIFYEELEKVLVLMKDENHSEQRLQDINTVRGSLLTSIGHIKLESK